MKKKRRSKKSVRRVNGKKVDYEMSVVLPERKKKNGEPLKFTAIRTDSATGVDYQIINGKPNQRRPIKRQQDGVAVSAGGVADLGFKEPVVSAFKTSKPLAFTGADGCTNRRRRGMSELLKDIRLAQKTCRLEFADVDRELDRADQLNSRQQKHLSSVVSRLSGRLAALAGDIRVASELPRK